MNVIDNINVHFNCDVFVHMLQDSFADALLNIKNCISRYVAGTPAVPGGDVLSMCIFPDERRAKTQRRHQTC